jgi:hypothetical protein
VAAQYFRLFHSRQETNLPLHCYARPEDSSWRARSWSCLQETWANSSTDGVLTSISLTIGRSVPPDRSLKSKSNSRGGTLQDPRAGRCRTRKSGPLVQPGIRSFGQSLEWIARAGHYVRALLPSCVVSRSRCTAADLFGNYEPHSVAGTSIDGEVKSGKSTGMQRKTFETSNISVVFSASFTFLTQPTQLHGEGRSR